MPEKYGSLTDRQRNAQPLSSLARSGPGGHKAVQLLLIALGAGGKKRPRKAAQAVFAGPGRAGETLVFAKSHRLLLGRF